MESVNYYVTNKGIKKEITSQENQKLKAIIEKTLTEIYRCNINCKNVKREDQIYDKVKNDTI